MRQLTIVASAVLAAASVACLGTPAAAGSTQGGAVVSVSVQLPGFRTPSKYWDDPCDDEGPFSEYFSGEIDPPVYRDAELDVALTHEKYDRAVQHRPASYGPDTQVVFVETHTAYQRYCFDPETGAVDAGSWESFWVPIVSVETVVPALFERIWDYIEPPELSWPSADGEFGWLYVQTPMDFRIDAVESVELRASVTNVTGTVSAWVTATPVSLTLEPGEPGGVPVVCSMAGASAPFVVAVPGECSYTFQNSSAVAGSGVFGVHASVLWQIETSDPGFPVRSVRTWSGSSVEVAEVQAVVSQ